jgi:enamine deaminase RidA (YjgF/YER057c/UK114 family)
VELKTRCVRVIYAGDCHVDLVPYVHTSGWFERHEIVNRTENGFEQVNPSGFTDWMRNRDRLAAGNLRTTIRLLKYLRDYKQTFAVPSVILTVIVGSRVSWWRSQLTDQYAALPTAFTRLVTDTDRWLQERPDLPEIADPSCPEARFDHRLTQRGYGNFRDQFHEYAGQIRAAYNADERDTLIRSASLSDVAEYAYAATAPAESRLIFLAGACPLNDDGSTAAIGDYAGQAAKAIENVQAALTASGASLQDVISTRVLVASARREDLVAAWEVVRDSFGDHDVPSTLMGVTVLGYKDQLVEIEAVAAVLDS